MRNKAMHATALAIVFSFLLAVLLRGVILAEGSTHDAEGKERRKTRAVSILPYYADTKTSDATFPLVLEINNNTSEPVNLSPRACLRFVPKVPQGVKYAQQQVEVGLPAGGVYTVVLVCSAVVRAGGEAVAPAKIFPLSPPRAGVVTIPPGKGLLVKVELPSQSFLEGDNSLSASLVLNGKVESISSPTTITKEKRGD